MKNLFLLLAVLFAVNASAIQKVSKEDACKRVVDKNMISWLEVCDLDQEKQKELYAVLFERQGEIYDARKANSGNKAKQKEEVVRIRKAYMPKVEKTVGEENVEMVKKHFEGQIGISMLDLMDAKI